MNASLTKKLRHFFIRKIWRPWVFVYCMMYFERIFFLEECQKVSLGKRNKQVMHFQLLKFIHHIFNFFLFFIKLPHHLWKIRACYFPDRHSFSYFSFFEMILQLVIILTYNKDLKSTVYLLHFQIAVVCFHNFKFETHMQIPNLL